MDLIIERIFIAVIQLSLCGFVFCAVFLPFERLAYKLSSAKTMVMCNTLALFSFVIPIHMLAAIYDNSEYVFSTYSMLVCRDNGGFEGFAAGIRDRGLTDYFLMIWLVGAMIYFCYILWKYFRLVKNVRENMFLLQDEVWSAGFEKLQKVYAIRNTQLVASNVVSSPCTVGIRQCYIVIPAYMIDLFDEEEVELILRHEFYHVIHRDIPRKVLVAILNCLNWFNPLYLLLRKNLSEWIEAACDESVTNGLDKKQNMKYCQLMIKVLELEMGIRKESEFCNAFAKRDMHDLKRRMERIVHKKKNRTSAGKAAVVSVLVFAMALGSAVAKAADVPVNMLFSSRIEVFSNGEFEEVEYEEVEYEEAVGFSE